MSIYTNRVQAPVEKQPLTGFDKPLQSFKEMSTVEIAKKEKERAEQLASEQESQTKADAERNEQVRKQAEESRKRQEQKAEDDRKKYLAMSEDVDAPDNMKMYGSHYHMLEDLATHLANPDVIKEYASTVEGEMEFNALVEQLLTLTDTFEAYFKQTYGDYNNDDIGASTLQAAERRHRERVQGGDISYDTPYEEMISRYRRLEDKSHESMEIRGGRVVFIDSEGNEIIPGEDMLDLNVFQTEVSERAPLTGGQYIGTVFDPDVMSSPEDVRSYVEQALESETVMHDAARHYVEVQMDKNPDFSKTPGEVKGDPRLRLAAQELYIKEAMEEAAKRQGDLAETPDEGSQKNIEQEPSDEEKQEASQVSEQAETTEAAVQEDKSAIEESTAQLEQALGRTPTEEEIQMLFDPEMQAMLRAIGFGGPQFPDGPPNPYEPTPEEVQAFAQDMGLNLRDVSMDMFEPDTPLGDAFRQYNIERSRIRSLVDQQRGLNAERNQTMVDDFGDKFSGDLQEALANYGQTPEVQAQPSGDQGYNFEDEKINKMVNKRSAFTTEGSTSTRGFEGENVKIDISPDNQEPRDLVGVSFDVDKSELVVNLSGDRQVKFTIDRDGNINMDPTDMSSFMNDLGDRIPMGVLVPEEFNKIYGEGAFGALASVLRTEALRSAGLLAE